MKKRALLTNFFFAKYTGSELHVLEIARLLEKKGYEVTIAVFDKAYPLLEKAGTIHVIDVLKEKLECVDYDIVFVQHYPVLDYLCCNYNISYKKLIISKLSVIHPLEHLPVCTKEADLILCVSDECADEVRQIIGANEKIRVFKNSVSEGFFETYQEQKSVLELKKIAVISNHVPKELLEFSQIAKGKYEVDYIGMQYGPRLVNPKLLKEYDLIITIGRTVQQCFAAGVPVYVYDYFGGPGYIGEDNFVVAEKNNFSGRGGFGKKTALELQSDIESNYQKNLSNLERLNAIAKKEYSSDLNFERIYQELLPEAEWYSKRMDFYSGTEKQRISLYSKSAPAYELGKKYFSKLYFDCGDGFNENDSVWWSACENYTITKRIELDTKVRKLRFDPCDEPTTVSVFGIYINGKCKEEIVIKQKRIFEFDPKFIIELSEEEQNTENLIVEIVYQFKTLDWEETLKFYNDEKKELINQNHILSGRVKELEETIETIKDYYKISPRNIMKRVLNHIKR